MTAGGNDVNFSTIIYQCFIPGYGDPGDCRENVKKAEDLLIEDGPDGIRPLTENVLTRLHDVMRSDTKVGLVSYPYLEMSDNYKLRHKILGVTNDTYSAGAEVGRVGLLGDTKQEQNQALIDQQTTPRHGDRYGKPPGHRHLPPERESCC